jgi:hypothetical protein
VSENLRRARSAFEKERETDNFTEELLTWAGACTIFFVGSIHLLISGEHFLAATYLGALFLANFFGSILAAFGLYWGAYRWAWLLGVLISGGAFVGFIASRAAGLPNYPQVVGQWVSLNGLSAMALEGLFVALFLLAATPWGRSLTRGVEQGREKVEQVIFVEPPGRIEQRMAETRSRMAPDLVDLRRHVEPQVIKERAQQRMMKYIRGVRISASGGRQQSTLAALVVLAAVAALVLRRGNGRDG